MSLIYSKTVLELYDLEIHHPIIRKNRLRNLDARHERIETSAVIKNRRDQSGVERGPGECYQWKAKGQSRGDNCSFRHDENKRAKWTQKSAPPSELPKGRSLRGWSPPGKLVRQPCRE